jgi:hypothetical protein
MEITDKWLEEKRACAGGRVWFGKQKKSEAVDVLKALIKEDQLDWANWTIVRVMTRPQYLAYAIYAADQVIGIYEKKYPNNDKPRKAIEAAKAVLANDTEETRAAAAAYASYAAAYAAYAAAAYAAAYASYAAAAYAAGAYAASAAAAYAAAAAAAYAAAASDAAADADDARKKMKTKILRHGIKLLEAV